MLFDEKTITISQIDFLEEIHINISLNTDSYLNTWQYFGFFF